ncbi:MAG: UDP-N-acetylenolpyruvoylglucosamine reductase [Spirochaetes bacterium GWD1_61_31]|nr:MAG: UDP-N-acetylenolpyruvoylglucosamine reductase [Spirochaetes bacterium GWB1_60_80]OHD32134.1 MAG: UDP-N-acetylenolpyruvoylglucosamine reductase [Spirochaetes bacterium GWC1_61_12]OHD37131.1 MAG: UDP-N-acetylenolpyruvoylglucosamine reductase [Spirochaetes bacterium GWD1_61_31]OHD42653.1 MAG: UDP-N-acetylenolpyruvoylglucosamine reductase [Spirochaetes bacterium GWE1_60_18]OHD58534.1 MAG: UDP-N-acetylenolpyruvoylglucosamine reductase [Spirochaetes bacterium GWF1_60_12]HAP43962.1 UDP-N-acet
MTTISHPVDQAANLPSRLRQLFSGDLNPIPVQYDEPLAGHTTLRIGGPADAFASPASILELKRLLRAARAAELPLTILGGGANVLVGDRGIRGLVVATGRLRRRIRLADDSLYAGAGLAADQLCQWAADEGRAGLEFLSGLPGSVGGAVFMNARCYECELADVISAVDYLAPDLTVCDNLAIDRSQWAYKRTPFMPGGSLAGAIILGARFTTSAADGPASRARMLELRADRVAKGHFDYPSAGSLFKNDRSFGRPTGAILDELGFRGRRIGDAMVSPKHANIFVNAGQASAADMLRLIEEAQAAARLAFGIELEPEVIRLGE